MSVEINTTRAMAIVASFSSSEMRLIRACAQGSYSAEGVLSVVRQEHVWPTLGQIEKGLSALCEKGFLCRLWWIKRDSKGRITWEGWRYWVLEEGRRVLETDEHLYGIYCELKNRYQQRRPR